MAHFGLAVLVIGVHPARSLAEDCPVCGPQLPDVKPTSSAYSQAIGNGAAAAGHPDVQTGLSNGSLVLATAPGKMPEGALAYSVPGENYGLAPGTDVIVLPAGVPPDMAIISVVHEAFHINNGMGPVSTMPLTKLRLLLPNKHTPVRSPACARFERLSWT